MRFPRSLQWRIALAYAVLILVSLAVVGFFVVNIIQDSYVANLEERLAHEAGLVGEAAARYLEEPVDFPGLRAATDRAGQLVDARVTIIGANGQVLADTWQPPGDLANQAGQPEVREALGSGLGRVARADSPGDSSTSGELLYTASPIRRGERLLGVGRIGVPTSRIDANLNRVIASVSVGGFVVAVIAIGMGLYIARRGSRSVRYVAAGARRFAEGNLDPPLHVTGADETRELAEAFNYMADSLQSSIRNLTEERNKLSVVLEVMADGVIVIGPDRRATLLNPAARELLGVADTGANGVNLEDLVGGAWLTESSGTSLKWVPLYPDLRRLIADCFEQRERQHADLELYRPHRVVSAVATPLGGGVDPPGVLLTLHDLTRIRQVERSQQEFVSNVSHELRNPLASMKAMVETLEDGALQETDIASDFLQRLHREIDRVTVLGDDLLDLSRLEGGQPQLDLAPVDLLSLAEDVQSQLADIGSRKGVTVEVDASSTSSQAWGDRRRLHQVLVNLVENALKFTQPGDRISIKVCDDGPSATVEVSDTGCGVASRHLPRLFERFYKADRARQDGGSGLGLAIVKQIVTAHGGDVTVESREDVGSTFRFQVPKAP